ncbi:hypothetical protein ACYCAX_08400 [Pseudomonas sp. MT3]
MRILNSLTQNLIENLTQLLKHPGQEALQTLEVCAPVLIDELQQIKERAVDRRDIGPQIQAALDEWLQQHPLPEKAQEALIEALRRQSLIPPVPPSGTEK